MNAHFLLRFCHGEADAGGGTRAGQGKGVIALGRARPLDEHTPFLLKKVLRTILAGAAVTFISPLMGSLYMTGNALGI